MREREESSCEICGFSRFVELAHIVPQKDGGTFHSNNIAFLCPNHHRLHDSNQLSTQEVEKIEEKIRLAIVEGYGWE